MVLLRRLRSSDFGFWFGLIWVRRFACLAIFATEATFNTSPNRILQDLEPSRLFTLNSTGRYIKTKPMRRLDESSNMNRVLYPSDESKMQNLPINNQAILCLIQMMAISLSCPKSRKEGHDFPISFHSQLE